MSDYEYDVFLSYRRGQRSKPGGEWPLDRDGEWVHKVFFPEFKHWLDQEFSSARNAFDANFWLYRSERLVAVWNPLYFRSKFCRSEFHSMLGRARP